MINHRPAIAQRNRRALHRRLDPDRKFEQLRNHLRCNLSRRIRRHNLFEVDEEKRIPAPRDVAGNFSMARRFHATSCRSPPARHVLDRDGIVFMPRGEDCSGGSFDPVRASLNLAERGQGNPRIATTRDTDDGYII